MTAATITAQINYVQLWLLAQQMIGACERLERCIRRPFELHPAFATAQATDIRERIAAFYRVKSRLDEELGPGIKAGVGLTLDGLADTAPAMFRAGFRDARTALGRAAWIDDVAGVYAPLEAGPPRKLQCVECGCDEDMACIDVDGEPCHWVSDGLCSRCWHRKMGDHCRAAAADLLH